VVKPKSADDYVGRPKDYEGTTVRSDIIVYYYVDALSPAAVILSYSFARGRLQYVVVRRFDVQFLLRKMGFFRCRMSICEIVQWSM